MKRFKKALAMVLAFAIVFSSFVLPGGVVTANESHLFSGSGFTVNFTVHSSWNNGYSAAVEITNTGSQPVEEWKKNRLKGGISKTGCRPLIFKENAISNR